VPFRICIGADSDNLGVAQYSREQEAEMVDDLKGLLSSLPSVNQRVLHFLIGFLHKVVSHKAENKMDSSNLAVCFGPNIIRPREQTIEYTLNIPKANSAFQCIIDHAAVLFDDPELTLAQSQG
jgi:Rho GTPase-activating protein 26